MYTGHFTINGPKIIASSLAAGATILPGAQLTEQVTFNEEMAPATFTPDQVLLSGPGGTYNATSVTAVTGSGNTRFDIVFDARVTGHFTMAIGPNILDTFGTAMDQD